MVKHTKTICRQWQTNRLGDFDHFMGSNLKGLTSKPLSCKGSYLQLLSNDTIKVINIGRGWGFNIFEALSDREKIST